jgi:hypothetical protein
VSTHSRLRVQAQSFTTHSVGVLLKLCCLLCHVFPHIYPLSFCIVVCHCRIQDSMYDSCCYIFLTPLSLHFRLLRACAADDTCVVVPVRKNVSSRYWGHPARPLLFNILPTATVTVTARACYCSCVPNRILRYSFPAAMEDGGVELTAEWIPVTTASWQPVTGRSSNTFLALRPVQAHPTVHASSDLPLGGTPCPSLACFPCFLYWQTVCRETDAPA